MDSDLGQHERDEEVIRLIDAQDKVTQARIELAGPKAECRMIELEKTLLEESNRQALQIQRGMTFLFYLCEHSYLIGDFVRGALGRQELLVKLREAHTKMVTTFAESDIDDAWTDFFKGALERAGMVCPDVIPGDLLVDD